MLCDLNGDPSKNRTECCLMMSAQNFNDAADNTRMM